MHTEHIASSFPPETSANVSGEYLNDGIASITSRGHPAGATCPPSNPARASSAIVLGNPNIVTASPLRSRSRFLSTQRLHTARSKHAARISTTTIAIVKSRGGIHDHSSASVTSSMTNSHVPSA
eukprot:31480-Pelagococcus_subviridis.AAC.11